MKEITITVRLSLENISKPSSMSEILTSIENEIQKILPKALNAVATETLEMAKDNADEGYRGLPYPGRGAGAWAPRDAVTDLLYSLSPWHMEGLPGLTTGRDQLINSLKKGDRFNIFEVEDNSITIGSRFRYADLLEHGGPRPSDVPPLGFKFGANGLMPTRWLRNNASPSEIDWILSQVEGTQYIPPRPFLFPAMWFMEDKEWHTGIMAEVLIRELEHRLSSRGMNQVRGDRLNVI